jgi:hypothetical protein
MDTIWQRRKSMRYSGGYAMAEEDYRAINLAQTQPSDSVPYRGG